MDFYYPRGRGLRPIIRSPRVFINALRGGEENLQSGDVLIQICLEYQSWSIHLWVRGTLRWHLLQRRYLYTI
jgi:hypothetical protein